MDEKFSTDFYNDSIENYKKYYCGGREEMVNYTFWDNDYNEIILQKEIQHTREEIQEMALEFFNNYEDYRVDEDFNYCENFIQYLVTERGFSFPKVDSNNVYDIYLLKGIAKQEEEKNNCLENIKTIPKTTDISNTFMDCSTITGLPKEWIK